MKENYIKETGYMRVLRCTLGDMFTSCQENLRNMHPYSIIDGVEDRAIGILIETYNIYKLVRKLEGYGLMVIKETKLSTIGDVNNTWNQHIFKITKGYITKTKKYVLVLRLPEDEDVEEKK